MDEQDATDAGTTVDADDREPSADDATTDETEEPGVEGRVDDRGTSRADAVDDQLVERVADSDPEAIANEIATLRVQVEGLEAELAATEETVADQEETIEELESKLARARADFQNYKKRTEQRREEARERATADLVERLLDVHDNLQRALDQDEDVDIRGGVESTLQQFDDVLAAENVTAIEPSPGEDVDPHRHEVLVRVESDQPEGTIESLHRVGYEMGGTIVREAQVTVSDGSGDAGGNNDQGSVGTGSGADANDNET